MNLILLLSEKKLQFIVPEISTLYVKQKGKIQAAYCFALVKKNIIK